MNKKIGFGTWPLGGLAYGQVKESIALATIETAIDNGIRFFDTANIYGDGKVEKYLGRIISTIPDAIIVSKCGYISEKGTDQNFTESYLSRSLDNSLQRLRKNKIDILLLHSPPEEIIRNGRACEIMDTLRQNGLVVKTGISLRSIDTFEAALKWEGCSVIEVILNLLDQRPIDDGLIEKAYEQGVDVIARVPLCFGILSGIHQIGATFSVDDQRSRWSRNQIDNWIGGAERFRFLENSSRSLLQAALAFCISFKEVTYAIPGMKTPEQVRHNILAASSECLLSSLERNKIRQIWNTLKLLPPGR